MKRYMVVLFAILTAGCANDGGPLSVFNPAPFVPINYSSDTKSPLKVSTSDFQLDSYAAARTLLWKLSASYAGARDSIYGGQLLFDVPIVGLGIASLASLSFRGAASVTTGLAFGSAGFAGTKLYFEPGTKAAAYNVAASSLQCAAGAAGVLYGVAEGPKRDVPAADTLLSMLQESLALARTTIVTPPGGSKPPDVSALVTARDAGQKAADDLGSALQTIVAGPYKMASFAEAAVRIATNTVVKGAPTTDDILSKIKSGQSVLSITSAANPNANPGRPAPLPANQFQPAAPPTPAEQVARLDEQSSEAKAITTVLTNAWTQFTACSTVGS